MAGASDDNATTAYPRQVDNLFNLLERLGLDVKLGERRKRPGPSVVKVVPTGAKRDADAIVALLEFGGQDRIHAGR